MALTIDGIYYTEPELAAKFREMQEREKEFKRLLRAAVKDFKVIIVEQSTCEYCKWFNAETTECDFPDEDTPCKDLAGWEHEGEVEKLIGGEDNDN